MRPTEAPIQTITPDLVLEREKRVSAAPDREVKCCWCGHVFRGRGPIVQCPECLISQVHRVDSYSFTEAEVRNEA